ncbi:unnamed protein product [Heligmosomoides polygyrus]|uniref:Integral membrane protein n=1 Tax=Heligmosomoides polygyrus TaxID=6339 RepID=A0A183GU27_HELPZ|nr:unnamed protein product [Heligmosomoides polygyrus]
MLQYIIAGALIFEIIRFLGLPDASTVKYSKPMVSPLKRSEGPPATYVANAAPVPFRCFPGTHM